MGINNQFYKWEKYLYYLHISSLVPPYYGIEFGGAKLALNRFSHENSKPEFCVIKGESKFWSGCNPWHTGHLRQQLVFLLFVFLFTLLYGCLPAFLSVYLSIHLSINLQKQLWSTAESTKLSFRALYIQRTKALSLMPTFLLHRIY